jgi:hypothetical protein
MQLNRLRKSGLFDSRREAETRQFMTEVVGTTAAVDTYRPGTVGRRCIVKV